MKIAHPRNEELVAPLCETECLFG